MNKKALLDFSAKTLLWIILIIVMVTGMYLMLRAFGLV